MPSSVGPHGVSVEKNDTMKLTIITLAVVLASGAVHGQSMSGINLPEPIPGRCVDINGGGSCLLTPLAAGGGSHGQATTVPGTLVPNDQMQVMPPMPHKFMLLDQRGVAVTTDLDANPPTVDLHGMQPDAAARVFWNAVALATRHRRKPI